VTETPLLVPKVVRPRSAVARLVKEDPEAARRAGFSIGNELIEYAQVWRARTLRMKF
jgi:hypothetical protein